MQKLTLTLLGALCISSSAFAATSSAPVVSASCKNTPVAAINTNLGTIEVQLDAKSAPVSVSNFITYVNSGFYNGKIFHRVIPGFMIQGGGFDKNMIQAPTNASIKNEADNGLMNSKYTISMARTSIPDSATSQFFINVANNTSLDYTSKTDAGWGYAVFGKVIKGTDVVDKIAMVPTGNKNGYQDVPKTTVVITSAKMLPCK